MKYMWFWPLCSSMVIRPVDLVLSTVNSALYNGQLSMWTDSTSMSEMSLGSNRWALCWANWSKPRFLSSFGLFSRSRMLVCATNEHGIILPKSRPDAKENAAQGPLFRETPPRPLFERVLRLGLFALSVSAVSGGMIGLLAFMTYAQNLPDFDSVQQYRPKLVTKVYSSDGRLIGEFGTERRTVVPYERIPKHLIQAFIASEDKKFFDHHGIDYVGIINAVLQKVTGRRKSCGAPPPLPNSWPKVC